LCDIDPGVVEPLREASVDDIFCAIIRRVEELVRDIVLVGEIKDFKKRIVNQEIMKTKECTLSTWTT
jgi:hypothetical protein